jgi:hypothetical protein
MWTALALLVLLIGLGAAGITGRGAVDTRDPEYTARLTPAAVPREPSRQPVTRA